METPYPVLSVIIIILYYLIFSKENIFKGIDPAKIIIPPISPLNMEQYGRMGAYVPLMKFI